MINRFASRHPASHRLSLLTCLALGLLAFGAAGVQANTLYVSGSGGSDANTGASWQAAFATVQAGVNAANYGDQVWVQAGTYVQNITLKDGVGVYGGFNGTETQLSQRNWTANVTILDGNNSGSVVTIPAGVGTATQLDGFTIQNGNTSSNGGGIACSGSATVNNNTITHNTANGGGGIECDTGSPVIANNIITANTATNQGGGVYSQGLNPVTLSGNTITWNISQQNAGGLLVTNSSQATIAANTISNNTAANYGGVILYSCSGDFSGNTVANNTETANGYGAGLSLFLGTFSVTNNEISGNVSGPNSAGGLYCYQINGTISNNTITRNHAGGWGGAIQCSSNSNVQITQNIITHNVAAINSGGIECNCTALIANNLIAHNKALQYGGGISIATGSPVSLLNNTIVDNAAVLTIGGVNVWSNPPSFNTAPIIGNNIIAFNLHGGIVQNNGSSATLSHNCVYGNSSFNVAGSTWSDYFDVTPGAGDISSDPLFIDRAALDYRLQPASPCIDTGDDTLVSAGELDLDGNGRIYGPHVDIGAYEAQPVLVKFSLKPSLVVGGFSTTGTLTLDMPAPAGGAEVILISDNAAVTGPVTVIIPAGATSQTFPITTAPVAATQTGAITALYGDDEISANLTVRPIGVKTLSLKPTKVVGGNSVTGTVTLEAAPDPTVWPQGITVSLSSSDSSVAQPVDANGNPISSITIPANSLTGTFTLNTSAVTTSTVVKITATANGVGKTASLTVTP